jgi:hypothetical protein
MKNKTLGIKWLGLVATVVGVTAFASIAAASLTFSGAGVTANSAVVIDGSSTISIGTSTATGITIGNPSSTVSFPGNVAVGSTILSGSATSTLSGNVQLSANGSLVIGNTFANLGASLSPGAFLVGNQTYACGTSDSFGNCAPFQIESEFTPDGNSSNQDFFEGNITLVPTADILSPEPFAFGCELQGAHNYTSSGLPTTCTYIQAISNTTGIIDTLATGYFHTNLIKGTVNQSADVWIDSPDVQSGSIGTREALYIAAQSGSATNTYDMWVDEQGVFRIKADNSFNSVYQAIPDLYNPQFTKYTPGASNYERLTLGEWNSNVAEIGTENSGSGSARALAFITASTTRMTIGATGNVSISTTTFSSLGTCNSGVEGSIRPVTDAPTSTIGATISAGSGSNHVLAYCDGTNWTVMAK